MQAVVLRAVVDHPSLAPAREVARIDLLKMQAAYKYVCKQSTCLMERYSNRENLPSRTKDKKLKVILTFSAPLPEKVKGVPSQCDCARVLGIPQSTLATKEQALIEKCQQLSTGKAGIFWALSKRKKGYSKIDEVTWSFLVEAFNAQPHVIVSPNARDTLQVKNVDGEKVAVPKLLMQVGLGTISSDIIKDNPTIKNKVGGRAFCYIISGLGSIRRFTNSYKQMCGCTECVGLHTLHCLLLAKCSVMHRQFAVDTQHHTREVQAAEKASRWGAVAWHPKPLLAISDGVCMLCRTGSVRHSSAATARSTPLQRRRHERTEPRRTYPSMCTSTRSVYARTARSVGSWSLCRSAQR